MSQVHQPGSYAWLRERDLARAERSRRALEERQRLTPPSRRHFSTALLVLLSFVTIALPAPPQHRALPPLKPHVSQRGLAADVARWQALALTVAEHDRDQAIQQRDQLQQKANDLQGQVDQLKQQLAALQAASVGVGSGPVAPSAVSASNWLGANRFAFGYCTWWVAHEWYLLYGRTIPWLGNAIEWWGNARAYSYAEGLVPKVGAIQVSRDSWYGHVALVTALYADGSWLVSEMNWTAWDFVDSRHVYPGGTLVGFIY